MSIHRIKISLLHTWYHFTHSMETWVDLFWNSALQMLIFAFLAVVFSKGDNPLQGMYMIAGMVFWNVIWSAQYGISVGVLWEIWSHSLSSLFITPLTLEEFLVGQGISSAVKAFISIVITVVVGSLVYDFSMAVFGWMIPVYFILLFFFGIAMGMFVISLIFRFGTDVQSLSWSIVFLVQPLGAVFYPVEILPSFVRTIAFGIPTTYIYETIRGQLKDGSIQWNYILIATGLTVIYFIGAYLFLKTTYNTSKRIGRFARLEG